MGTGLEDRFGRRFGYLRLSVTDVCNFRCTYCLPQGYQRGPNDFLSRTEIRRLVHGFAELGIRKLRITGGEPLVRHDILDIVSEAAATPGIERLAMSTNAYRLAGVAAELRRRGLHALNISLDSLDPATFEGVTGTDSHAQVMAGIDAALAAGFDAVKINAVLLAGVNDGQLEDFMAYVRARPVSVRFIELMRTTSNEAFFAERHQRGAVLGERLRAAGWSAVPRDALGGPAQEYAHPDYQGRIGLIEPYAAGFCDSCNRLRVTARGGLRLCLFGEGAFDLRPYLQTDRDREVLKRSIVSALFEKGPSHLLLEGDPGDTPHLAMTGG